jgi:hypothetical protein
MKVLEAILVASKELFGEGFTTEIYYSTLCRWGFTVMFNKNTYGAYHEICCYDVSDTPTEFDSSTEALLYNDKDIDMR